jgi:nucleolar protein 58
MGKIVNDNLQYAKAILKMGYRSNAAGEDFSDIMPDDIEAAMKASASISMGTDISEQDLSSIKELCGQVHCCCCGCFPLAGSLITGDGVQVVSLMEYRRTLYDYLTNRMNAIAPNLTVLVGELVGARLIAHAGSLMNLAKQPASTVQILGAEKALFRALKTKHETPKYGLIYHASLVGQCGAKNKGKISRVLAAKAALAIRVDALGEGTSSAVGSEGRDKVEARLRQLEGGVRSELNGTAKYVTVHVL